MFGRWKKNVKPIRCPENWQVYDMLVDGELSLIAVNAGFVEVCKLDSSPDTCLTIRTSMTDTQNGFPQAEELRILRHAEDEIDKILEKGLGINVGRKTGGGVRDIFVYTDHAKEVERLAKKKISQAVIDRTEFVPMDDPDHSIFRDYLMPDAWSKQRISNRDLLDILASHGDNHERVRMINHASVLPSRDVIKRYQNFLEKDGFTVKSTEELEDGSGLMIFFEREDSLADVDALVRPLFDKANELGGDYDGWGAVIANA